MPDTTTLNESVRSPITGAEAVRLATTGANWQATIAAIQKFIFSNPPVTVTPSAGTITVDLSTGFNFTVTLNAAGMTFALPTNIVVGQSGIILLLQDATGNRTITTWAAGLLFPGGRVLPVLSTTPNATDLLTYECIGAATLLMGFQGNYA